MYSFYDTLIFLLSPIASVLFALHPRGRIRLMERFGFWGIRAEVVWFHGASLGEVRGIIPIVKKLKLEQPETKVLITCISATGLNAATEHGDYVKLLPFDCSLFYRNAFSRLKVRKFILAETELWPGMLKFVKNRHIPAYMINARMLKTSLRLYKFFPSLFALSIFKYIFTQDLESLNNFRQLNVLDLELAGNSKFDNLPSVQTESEKISLRSKYFINQAKILVLGSLRPGEEEYFQNALKNSSYNIILAPRHSEKFDYFASFISKLGLEFDRASLHLPSKTRIVLLDTVGELEKVYAIANTAFIGASLVEDIGGHNPLEAAAYGVSILMGPHYSKQKEVVSKLIAGDAITIVNNLAQVDEVLSNTDLQNRRALNSREVYKSLVGAQEIIYPKIFGAKKC